MIIVDTSVVIDMYRQIDNSRTRKLKALAVSEDVILLDVVMLEILQGARDDLHSRRLEENLRGFRPERAMTFALAVSGAMYSRKLRGAGVTIPQTMDLVIGTWCIENDCALLHNDRDFLPMVEHLGLKEF
jgi:predicted nucleic acid-binding protein